MNITGLTESKVEESRKKHGNNSLGTYKRSGFLKLLLESLGDPIIKILLIALAIKVIFLFKDFDWYETIGIVLSILIASLVATISEYGSEAAFARLQEESSKITTKVIRNGNVKEISIDDVVVDDVVLLSSGDRIPADGFIISGEITVDESSLNGETKEVTKIPVDKYLKYENKVFRGSVVYSKEAKMKVTAVGLHTEYGKLALEIQEKQPDSPLKLKLRELANFISKIGYIGAGLVSFSYLFSTIVISNRFNLDLILKTISNFPVMASHILYALTLSVTIIIVAVPEGLPMMITLVLSSNMKKMLKSNVLVRKLVGIETAGCLNYLLTDKTGTLTKGKLKVSKFMLADLKCYSKLKDIDNRILYKEVEQSIIYNNQSVYNGEGKIIGGNSTDKAILKFGNQMIKNKVITETIPFDSSQKYSLVTIKDEGREVTYIKGAPELIINMCNQYYSTNGKVNYFKLKNEFLFKIQSLAKEGYRIVALASSVDYSSNKRLENFCLLGVMLIKDELRKEAKEGIALINKAGIKTIMITGDDKNTAISIAKEVGLMNSYSDIALSSEELNKMSDEEILKKINQIKVVSRALPRDKSRLVKIIENASLVVGMTGDGVNDAPALKKADVGFAMGSGTEVSKEAADIVILDNNILSISKAILYGRTIYKSIRKFIIFQLTVNLCALTLSIVGPFIGVNTPVTIIQMLWLNMIMDTFSGIAFSYEPALKEYMDEKPRKKKEPVINKYMSSQIIVSGLYSAFLCILFLKLPLFKTIVRFDVEYKYLMTAYFALFIFMDIFNAFNSRTEKINIFSNIYKNKVFLIMFGFITIVQIFLLYHGGNIFRTYGLTLKEFAITIIMACTIIPVDMIRKKQFKKKYGNIGV